MTRKLAAFLVTFSIVTLLLVLCRSEHAALRRNTLPRVPEMASDRGHVRKPDGTKSELLAALAVGWPCQIELSGETPRTFLFRSAEAVTESFVARLGHDGGALSAGPPTVFAGLEVGNALQRGRATLVFVDDVLGGVIRDVDGTTTYLRTHPVTGILEARMERFDRSETICQWDAMRGKYAMMTEDVIKTGEALWASSMPAKVFPSNGKAALTGEDPATGRLSKTLNPIPRGTRYDQSLKDALMVLVLDKDATGPNTEENLKSKASLFLATVSNVAGIYENQLGIRLLVQEMILIPDDVAYTDIPYESDLENFRTWMQTYRRQSLYHWGMAAKFGLGLTDQTLGVAYTQAFDSSSGVSMAQSDAIWDVLAHEMGHTLGADHTTGGLMNATSLNGASRSFFTDASAGVTAAAQVYTASANDFAGPVRLRNPSEIPFAHDDYGVTPIDTSLRLQPLNNDDDSVRNGAINVLHLEEVSAITPAAAGTVTVAGNELIFTPTQGFVGPVWLSYTLRGSVGNDGAGWLHKGDVAIDVGANVNHSPTEIALAPGASYSFFPSGGTGGLLTQPAQALLTRSRDDSRLLVLRVDAGARGTDTFRVGGRDYTLTYVAPFQAVDDVYVHNGLESALRFNPLLNDEAAGEPWVNPIKPVIGVGTFGNSAVGQDYFPSALRLISAANLTPEKGRLTTGTLDFTVNGQRRAVLDSTLTFTPTTNASGVAQLSYTAADAAGHESTGSIQVILPLRSDRLLDTGAMARYLVPQDAAVDSVWMLRQFDDEAWTPATTGLGYESSAGYEDYINTTIAGMEGASSSVYVRLPFAVDDPDAYTALNLRMRYDDGFVAYLNGVEVARANAPTVAAPLPWDAAATQSNGDSFAVQFVSFSLTSHLGLLRAGENVLALHGLNNTAASSDFLLSPELDAIVSGRELAIVSPVADTIAVPLGVNLVLSARAAGELSGVPVLWTQVAGPTAAAVIAEPSSLSTWVRFTQNGDYLLRLATEDGDVAELKVFVPGKDPSNAASAPSVHAGGDQDVEGLTIALEGSADEGSAVTWSVVDGPGQVVFAKPYTASTSAVFSSSGVYRLRLSAEREGVRTFDEAEIVLSPSPVMAGLAALATSATDITSDGATLEGTAFFQGEKATVRFLVGLTDAGPVESLAWDQVVTLENPAPGAVRADIKGLLFNAVYHYRLRVDAGGESVWSNPSTFTTQPAPTESLVLLAEGASGRVIVPLDDSLDERWAAKIFDDSNWTLGVTGVGYDLDTEYKALLGVDLESTAYGNTASLYLRVPFNVDDPSVIDSLTLRMRYDDAYVAYLNGQEVWRTANAPTGVLGWASAAVVRRDDDDALIPEAVDLSEFREWLVPGENVLAIHGMNQSSLNRDFLILPELEATVRMTYYQEWQGRYGLEGVMSGPLGDFDGDGTVNLLEYAMGGNPIEKESPRRLQISMEGGVEVSWHRRRDLPQRGVSIDLQRSVDLQRWTSVPSTEATVMAELDGLEKVTFRLEKPHGGSFWRLQVVEGENPHGE